MSLVHIAFIFQSNHTSVCLEVDCDPLKRCAAGFRLVDGNVHTYSNELH